MVTRKSVRTAGKALQSLSNEERVRESWIRVLKLAKKYGGRVLSTHYVNNKTGLEFECAAGHVFVLRPDTMFRGQWCPPCNGWVRRTLTDCHEWARQRGGECLSVAYVHANYPLRWRCAEGHEWSARPNAVRMGGWCAVCAGHKNPPLRDLQRAAEERGGTLVSRRHTDCRVPLRWRCRAGHEFERLLGDVRRGRWCQRCRREQRNWSLADMQALAAVRAGTLVERRYVDATTPMRWRCVMGHQWRATAREVLTGKWCPRCHEELISTSKPGVKLTLDDLRATAARMGGRCLATRYTGIRKERVDWRCAQGHTFTISVSRAREGAWCKTCRLRIQSRQAGKRDPPKWRRRAE